MPYYKATRPSGHDFYSGTVDYAGALASGEVITHPLKTTRLRDDALYYLSVATVPTDCTGMTWPCRLFEVEPVGDTWVPDAGSLPNKVACKALRVVREVDAVDALGPQGAQLRDLIGQARRLTETQLDKLVAAGVAAGVAARVAAWVAAGVAARVAAWDAAWDAARDAAWDAARVAAGDAARDAARVAAGVAAGDAARALTARDLIGTRPGWDQAAYDLLTGPWRRIVGPIHPDDADLS